MKDVWARPVAPDDIQVLDEWLRNTSENLFDADILTYKRNIRFLAATHGGEPLAFMPVQSCLVLDSLAMKPGITELEGAKAIAELIRYAVTLAHEQEMNEIYFLCKDVRVSAYAERHGFEVMVAGDGFRLFRLKVGNL